MSIRPKHPTTTPTATRESVEKLWDDTGLTKTDQLQWRSTFEQHYGPHAPGTKTWPARARRLHDYGLTPNDLNHALAHKGADQPLPANPHRPPVASRREESMDEDQMEARAALIQEVVLHLEFERFSAIYARDRYIWALSQAGWNHPQLAALFGMTKQRIQQLLKAIKREQGPVRKGIALP